jgi:cytochrome b561
MAEAVFEAHATVGKILVYLMFLHIAAALKHTLIDRDGNLFRMLPFGKAKA